MHVYCTMHFHSQPFLAGLRGNRITGDLRVDSIRVIRHWLMILCAWVQPLRKQCKVLELQPGLAEVMCSPGDEYCSLAVLSAGTWQLAALPSPLITY